MSKRTPKEGYEVGYCKPPRHTQFKPGQSGNPKGRPKIERPTTLDACMKQALEERVTVMVKGKPKTMTKMQLFCQQTLNDAIAGTIGLKRLVIESAMRVEDHEAWLVQQAEAEAAQNAPKEPIVIRLRLGEEMPEYLQERNFRKGAWNEN